MATHVNLGRRAEFGCVHAVVLEVLPEGGCLKVLSGDDFGGYFARRRLTQGHNGVPHRFMYMFSDERTAFAFKMRFG